MGLELRLRESLLCGGIRKADAERVFYFPPCSLAQGRRAQQLEVEHIGIVKVAQAGAFDPGCEEGHALPAASESHGADLDTDARVCSLARAEAMGYQLA